MISVRDLLMATTNPSMKVEIIIKGSIPGARLISPEDLWSDIICDGITNVVFCDGTATIYTSCVYVKKEEITKMTIKDLKDICKSSFDIKILDNLGYPVMGFTSSYFLDYIDEDTASKRISSFTFKVTDKDTVELTVYLYDRLRRDSDHK